MIFDPSSLDILGSLQGDANLLSSFAIILGAIFVVFQLRDDRKLIEASIQQADSSAEQARLTTEQLKQNYELSTVDLVTDIYDFANGLEFQRSWLTVIRAKIPSYAEFQKLPEEKQLAFYQVASLFESLGFLVEKGYVKQEIIDDMFATQLAWQSLESFITGVRQEYEAEDYYIFFEKLHKRLTPSQET